MSHNTPCDTLTRCAEETKQELADIKAEIADLSTMKNDIAEMTKTINKMGDILTAWDSVNGFGVTIKFIIKSGAIVALGFGSYHAMLAYFK